MMTMYMAGLRTVDTHAMTISFERNGSHYQCDLFYSVNPAHSHIYACLGNILNGSGVTSPKN